MYLEVVYKDYSGTTMKDIKSDDESRNPWKEYRKIYNDANAKPKPWPLTKVLVHLDNIDNNMSDNDYPFHREDWPVRSKRYDDGDKTLFDDYKYKQSSDYENWDSSKNKYISKKNDIFEVNKRNSYSQYIRRISPPYDESIYD